MISFGIKAVSADLEDMTSLSKNLECHVFFEDLLISSKSNFISTTINGFYKKGRIKKLAVHAPTTISGKEIFDLSKNGEHQKVAQMAAELVSSLESKEKIPLVFHAPALETRKKDKNSLLNRTIDSLKDLSGGVCIPTVETLPSHCWKNGKLVPTGAFHEIHDFEYAFSNLKSIDGIGITLDVCHFFMGKYNYVTLEDFVHSFSDIIMHVHVSDLRLEDPYASEGTQIGEGDLDFNKIFEILSTIENEVTIIPEIRDGYKNNGKGFKEAISRLEKFL